MYSKKVDCGNHWPDSAYINRSEAEVDIYSLSAINQLYILEVEYATHTNSSDAICIL